MAGPLWEPSEQRVQDANLTAFKARLSSLSGRSFGDYESLWQFSVEHPEEFWLAVWEMGGIRASARGNRVISNADQMPVARFFPDARLNFAENLLRRRDASPAIMFRREDGVRKIVSHAELHAQVSQFAQALREFGIRPGDRIGACLPNVPETVVASAAAAAVGAVWASCSPDFGASAILDRFGQIASRVLIVTDGYHYGGRYHDLIERVRSVAGSLPSVEHVVILPSSDRKVPLDGLRAAILWPELIQQYIPDEINFEQLPFNHPLYILFTSGTTGAPKCIVHGAGGTLIQHIKEHRLHCDIKPSDRVFYFTTCGWTMWNWLVSALASEATLLLYDGSPIKPDMNVLFDFADESGMTLFGTSAKFIDAIRKAGLSPIDTHKLETVRTITSTGSPLVAESFDYIYTHVKRDVHLASISGGTDIVSAFVGGDPTGPVWRGEIQARALGMRVEVFDERGRSVLGQKGELVCTAPIPCMPIGFWNDPGDTRFRAAYFEKYPGVWAHGDFAEITEHGGIIIYGRADAVLNPGGVRIGTAEIYRPVEQLDEVLESLAVGQRWNDDERVVLFVRLRDGIQLDDALRQKIMDQVRRNATPRHVPARIVQIADIPRTKSGKIVELAVRAVIHGSDVKNLDALANPEALELFRNLPELQT